MPGGRVARRLSLAVRSAAVVAGAGLLVGAGAALAAPRRWRARDLELAPGDDPLRLPGGEQRVVDTDDGAAVAVSLLGPADGPVVVLVHGWTNARQVWGPVARRLIERGHRVVVYDQRGHGASTVGSGGWSMARLGLDLAAVLSDLDLHDVVLVGHSMGGMSIQALAVERPDLLVDRARGVVLVATAAALPLARISGPLAGLLHGVDLRLVFGGRLAPFAARAAFGRRVRWSHLQAASRMLDATPAEVRDGFLDSMLAMDLRPGHAAMDVPTVVIAGRVDLLTPLPVNRALAASIAGAELVVLPGVGHMVPFEAPEVVAARVDALT